MMNANDPFTQTLETALKHSANSASGPNVLPSAAQYHGVALGAGLHVPFLSHLFLGLSTKTAVGLALASVVVGGGVAAAAVNGSPNPLNWGHQVVQQVTLCKAEYGPNASPTTSPTVTPTPTPTTSPTASPSASPTPKNVGQCVSQFAKQHGRQERLLHSHGKASPGAGVGKGQHGRPSSLPTPHHATGRPSSLPTPGHATGKPSSNRQSTNGAGGLHGQGHSHS